MQISRLVWFYINWKFIMSMCLIMLLVNIFLFARYSFLSDRPSGISEHAVSYDTLESGQRISHHLTYYINRYKLQPDYNETDILSTIQHVLESLASGNPLSLVVLKELNAFIKDKRDIATLLAGLGVTAGTSYMKGYNSSGETLIQKLNTTKPKCPDTPPNLLGYMPSNMAFIVPAWLESNYQRLVGGHHEPEECMAVEKLALLIPYRKRYAHLHVTLNNLLPVLIRQQLDFRIFVIEQAPPTTFNRGMLLNIGFLEALKLDNYDCFIFHDVDMSPLNDKCLYRCASYPRLMSTGISKWEYGLPYRAYFGGVVSISRDQFQNISGFSNLFFGWGGEDDDFRSRVIQAGYKPLRYPKQIGKYDTFNHLPDEGNSPNTDRLRLVAASRRRHSGEGLNTTRYKVTQVEIKPLYTWITVYINMTEVLQTTPKHLLDSVKNLLNQSQQFDHVGSSPELYNLLV